MKYHERTAHSIETKNYPFSCEHICCNLKFKTKKDKLLHHNQLEVKCKEEKDSLVLLIDKFQKGINTIVTHFNINMRDVEKNEDYVKLKSEFEETSQKLFDTEFFFQVLGEKLNIVKEEKKEGLVKEEKIDL